MDVLRIWAQNLTKKYYDQLLARNKNNQAWKLDSINLRLIRQNYGEKAADGTVDARAAPSYLGPGIGSEKIKWLITEIISSCKNEITV